jgi:CO/xanthine dehydrogenase FAD-binding subunit
VRVAGDGVTAGRGRHHGAGDRASRSRLPAPVARAVGGPQIRNMATVGGNLFAPHPYGDFAAALLALGARVVSAGQGGPRPLEDCCATATAPA